MNMKASVGLFIPPIFIQLARRLRLFQMIHLTKRPLIEWEYIPEGWAYAQNHSEVKGWNVQDILETYKQKWPKFVDMVQGTGPLGISHESTLPSNEDIYSHNTIMSFAYAITLAARKQESLSMFDWGGGIGHYFVLTQSLLPDMKIEYHCKDVPVLVKYGKQLFPEQHFYTDESCFKRTYNFVMASGSMHFAEDWRGLLASLTNATKGYIYI